MIIRRRLRVFLTTGLATNIRFRSEHLGLKGISHSCNAQRSAPLSCYLPLPSLIHAHSLTGASLLSRLALGTLSDYFAPWLLAAITLSTASLATFILWGVIGHALAGLLVFGLSYGIVAGGWTSLWTGFLRPVVSTYLCLSRSSFWMGG